ncbi:uncharacterized protein [Aegilops tauschii subsp. strangulata]|nr:putative ripening-related protein 7 [Aegilops tauschii subsp. strangulata]
MASSKERGGGASDDHSDEENVVSLSSEWWGNMMVNGFQQDHPHLQHHSDEEYVVSLSSEWYAGGARCGKTIRIANSGHLYINAMVVDECAGCDNEVGASIHIWRNFRLDPSLGQADIKWSDLDTST